VSESARGVSGNRIPYAPERILDVAIGYERGAWSGELGLNAISSQFADSRNTVAATADGQAGLIPGRTILRAAVTFAPAATPWRVRVTASNLADEVYLATRTDGAFAGARRQVAAELIWRR
jgi:outer membrane receptor for Fe3+-dicitrate